MSKKQLRSLEEIGNDLVGVSNMPCKPDWRKPKEGTIFDEDKSVKWNREEVLRKQEEYDNEVKRLNTEKHKRRDMLEKEAHEVIKSEMKNITLEDAKKIFDYAYDERYDCGYRDVISFIYDLIEVFEPMINRK